ncbi:heparinase II/III family protein [Tabrizicola sp. DMG-N-6]|uniref:Heparinase II/III family protein n=2 Tax=Szabonella alba TaxID=2804194 RepID=A0A8K0V736_9RHOB|nr:heparinase II/III family protein [Szabonella alba]MBL4916959.1 heparinase II/III family protein [Szabonella alba]
MTRLANRYAVWRACAAPPATGFVSQPEPRSIGLVARGRQLLAGNFLLAGHLVEAPGTSIWDVPTGATAFHEAAQGFLWLDDLAAVADARARSVAQGWVLDWIARYGRGRGPGWTPDLTGRRLIRWINHAIFLMNGRSTEDNHAFFRALTVQVVFLSRRWQAAAPGLPRFEALTGLIYAGLALTGLDALTASAVTALAGECDREIDAEGGLPTRNPEELLEVFTLLNWAAQALGEVGQPLPPPIRQAIERIAPTLRALRHADGGLARFHGGGRGGEGRLDQALAASGVKALPGPGSAMGFLRLAAGRTTLIVDAAAPPGGRAGASAHASTLAFEMTSGRRPVIVSCGNGAPFGADWHRAGRATASHSTLAVEGYSSSRLDRGAVGMLADRADVTLLRPARTAEGQVLQLAQDGWRRTHGLIHGRLLVLSTDGRHIGGQDELRAESQADRARLETALGRSAAGKLRLALRFHLHPDVDAEIDMGGAAVSLALKSGEIWVFRHDRPRGLALEPSVYLEKGRISPRASRQIVVSAELDDFGCRIGWTLAKAQDTPLAIRDLERDDPPLLF